MMSSHVLRALSLAIAAVITLLGAACLPAQIREANEAREAREAAPRDCRRGVASACLKAAVEDAYGRGPPIEEARNLLSRGCELGDGAACYELALYQPLSLRLPAYQRACALDHWPGCKAVAARSEADPSLRAAARDRLCALAPIPCLDLARILVRDEPEVAIRMAESACANDQARCADAGELIERARLPLACARAEPNWGGCIRNGEALPEACLVGIDDACIKYGRELSRRDFPTR